MPNILTQNDSSSKTLSAAERGKYTYRYPRGNALAPGEPMHDFIRDEVLRRAQISRSAIQNRFSSWQEVDKMLTAYIDLSESEKALKASDITVPVSIVLPLSYATLEILLTYLTAAFLDDPIFRYSGRNPEDEIGAALLELLISIQTQKGKAGMHLHTIFRDMFAYGFGIGAPTWVQKFGYKRVRSGRGLTSDPFDRFVAVDQSSQRVEALLYEGNKLAAIDPYHFLPDPHTPISDLQESEFVGWITRTNINNLLRLESSSDTFFNCQYVKHIDGTSVLGQNESFRDRYLVQPDSSTNQSSLNPVDIIWMYMDIIPNEMSIDGKRLGDAKRPEKWMFAIAGDSIVIAATPTNYDHAMYPVAAAVCDFDGHSISPMSRLEMTHGMSTLINFLVNSHITNVRKAINDMFVVDPTLVNMKDLATPKAGKIIRTHKKVWGQGVQHLVEQLKVTDVTQAHMRDVVMMTEYFNKIGGAVDPLSGQMQAKAGERRTAEEYRGTRSAALTRLERAARITSMQLMQDLGVLFASHTQQFMQESTYVKAIGDYEELLMKEYGRTSALVSPFDIMIDYDIVVGDGSIPNTGDPSAWAEIFKTVATDETLRKEFDIVRIFKHWARLTGAKNLSEFVAKGGQKATVRSDESVSRGVEAGNIISLEEAVASGRY